MNDILFRGSSFRSLNEREFRDKRIRGNEISIYHIDTAHPEFKEEVMDRLPDILQQYRDMSEVLMDYDLKLKNWETRWVVGGLSEHIGTPMFFANKRSTPTNPPVLLSFDKSTIPDTLMEVEYTPQWFNDNPEVYPHVDETGNGVMIYDDEIIGLTNNNMRPHEYSSLEELKASTTVESFGTDVLQLNVIGQYDQEHEYIHKGEYLSIGSSITSVSVCLLKKEKIGSSVRDYAEITSPHDDPCLLCLYKSEDIDKLSNEDLTRISYDLLYGRIEDYSDQLAVVVLEDYEQSKTQAYFDDIYAFYDGDNIYYEVEDLMSFMSP